MTYKCSQRTAWGLGLRGFLLCFFGGADEETGVGSHRVGLVGVSSHNLVLKSRMALCRCGFRIHPSGTLSFANPLANTDEPIG